MPRSGSAPGSHAWGFETQAVASIALMVACSAALVASLGWPARFATGFVGYLIGMLFVAAAIDGIMELVGGFVWEGRARYVRGAVLVAEALAFAMLTP